MVNFELDRERITRLITAVLPYAKLYVVEPLTLLEKQELPVGLNLAIDSGEKLTDQQLTTIRNTLQALHLGYPITVFDLTSIPMERRVDILEDALPWKN